MTESVGDLGEFRVIDRITERYRQNTAVIVGPGDDAAVIAAPDGRMVVTTDMLIEGRHFRRDWSTAHDVGRKAAAQNLSDVAAMGARATALTVGLGAPPETPASWVEELADGFRDECAAVGASVAGGDTVRSSEIVISVTAVGDLEGRTPVPRSGARAGDVVALCGRVGWAEAGYRVLSRGFGSPRVFVEAHRVPQVPYDAGPEAADLGATALCEVSDGLLGDLGHVASASAVTVDIDPTALDVPDQMREIAGALGADPLDWVLTGGDDNALVASFPPETALPDRWQVIGTVRDGEPEVLVAGAPYEGGPGGHVHFG